MSSTETASATAFSWLRLLLPATQLKWGLIVSWVAEPWRHLKRGTSPPFRERAEMPLYSTSAKVPRTDTGSGVTRASPLRSNSAPTAGLALKPNGGYPPHGWHPPGADTNPDGSAVVNAHAQHSAYSVASSSSVTVSVGLEMVSRRASSFASALRRRCDPARKNKGILLRAP